MDKCKYFDTVKKKHYVYDVQMVSLAVRRLIQSIMFVKAQMTAQFARAAAVQINVIIIGQPRQGSCLH